MKAVLLLVLIAVVGAGMASQAPEIRRYLKMTRM